MSDRTISVFCPDVFGLRNVFDPGLGVRLIVPHACCTLWKPPFPPGEGSEQRLRSIDIDCDLYCTGIVLASGERAKGRVGMASLTAHTLSQAYIIDRKLFDHRRFWNDPEFVQNCRGREPKPALCKLTKCEGPDARDPACYRIIARDADGKRP